MWLDGDRLHAVGSALSTGGAPDIDELLKDILGRTATQASIPTIPRAGATSSGARCRLSDSS
jgi:hypothetical protein